MISGLRKTKKKNSDPPAIRTSEGWGNSIPKCRPRPFFFDNFHRKAGSRGTRRHFVSGYCLISRDMRLSGHVLTKVKFAELSDEKIEEYVKSGLCMGKAGAYGIQDGYGLAERIEGDYDNVVGLPIAAIDPELKEFLK